MSGKYTFDITLTRGDIDFLKEVHEFIEEILDVVDASFEDEDED